MEKVSDRELKKLINLLGVSRVRWLWLDEKLTLTQKQINEIIGLDGDIKSKEKVYLTGEQFQRICAIYAENLRLKQPGTKVSEITDRLELLVDMGVNTETAGKRLEKWGKHLNRKNKEGEK